MVTYWNKHILEESDLSTDRNLFLCFRKVFPKGLYAEGLAPSLWCYWQVVKPLKGGDWWKEVRLQGPCPWSGHWDPQPFLSLLPGCHKVSLHVLSPWCTASPQAPKQQGQVTSEIMNQSKPFLYSNWLISGICYSSGKLTDTPLGWNIRLFPGFSCLLTREVLMLSIAIS
jgi:hypothetical protein